MCRRYSHIKTQNWQHTWEREREWVCEAQLSWTDERNCTALFAFSTRNFYLDKERHSHTNTEIVSGARLNVYVPVGDFWQPANQPGRTVYCQTNRYKVQIPVCRWKGEGEGGGWDKINDSNFERPSFGAGRSRMAAFDVSTFVLKTWDHFGWSFHPPPQTVKITNCRNKKRDRTGKNRTD